MKGSEEKLGPSRKETKSAHRESLSLRESKKAPFKPHFPKEMPIKYGNRISRRARCFLNCFWKAQKILIRLRSVLLLISQNQLILIEAWAESDLMFKASDRRRNEITFLLYGASNQRPGFYRSTKSSTKVLLGIAEMLLLAVNRRGKIKGKVIGYCLEVRWQGMRILNVYTVCLKHKCCLQPPIKADSTCP